MKIKHFLLICLLTTALNAQGFLQYDWPGGDKTFNVSASNWQMYEIKDWTLSGRGGETEEVQIPLLVKNRDQLTFSRRVKLPKNWRSEQTLYLITQGVNGSSYFYVNGHILGISPNSRNPFRLQIPAEYVKEDSVLNIEIRIKLPQSTDRGFPTIVHTFSEERYIGLASPLYLIVADPPAVNNVQFNLQHSEAGFTLNYRYDIVAPQNMKAFKIVEIIQRTSDQKILLRKQRYSRQLNGKKITLEGQIALAPSNVWSPENPQMLRFTLQAEVTFENGVKKFTRVQTFGARKIEHVRQKFYLNGQLVQIRGITMHLSPEIFAGKSYYAQLRRLLSFARGQGFNALRLAHFLPDEPLLRLADSLGLMVFAEFPLWRFPSEFFNENFLLEAAKNVGHQIRQFYAGHPSLTAIGLGQEIPLHVPVAQKFMFILNGKLKAGPGVLTYISPIPGFPLPPERVADFYIYDRYRPVLFLTANQHLQAFSLMGKIGFLTADLLQMENSEITHQINRGLLIRNELYKSINDIQPNGGFVECLFDWRTEYPNDLGAADSAGNVAPHGFLDLNGDPKPWTKLLGNPWLQNETAINDRYFTQQPKTNFFSILVTFSAILFFAIYRRVPRLRENFRRSLRHSYGFFVDLRERRIIPFFNSITVSTFIALIAAVFLASQIYFFHKSLWLQEILSVILIPLGLFKRYLEWSRDKLLITALLFLFFVLIPVIGAFVLKILAWINRSKIRYRQGFAIIAWAGAPFVWFFPFSLISYHWLLYQQPLQWLWIIFGIFAFWTQIRLINGIHILFIAKTSRVFSILLLCYFIPILIFWALFNPPGYWVDYLQLLMKAQSLF